MPAIEYISIKNLFSGLFSSAFMSSGAAFNSWAYQAKPLEKANELADVVQCPHITSMELLYCLQEIPGKDIVMAQVNVTRKDTVQYISTAYIHGQ